VLEHLTENMIVHYVSTLDRSYDNTLKGYSTRIFDRLCDSTL